MREFFTGPGGTCHDMWELCDCNIACGSCLSYVGQ